MKVIVNRSCLSVLASVERMAQLAHLLGEPAIVVSQPGRLATRRGHFLREYREHASQAAQAVEHLVAFDGVSERVVVPLGAGRDQTGRISVQACCSQLLVGDAGEVLVGHAGGGQLVFLS